MTTRARLADGLRTIGQVRALYLQGATVWRADVYRPSATVRNDDRECGMAELLLKFPRLPVKTSIGALLFALFLLPGVCTAAKDLTDEQRKTETVYEAPGHTSDQIFSAARMWMAENFKSSKAVIEYENRNEGTLIGNGSISYPCEGYECLLKADWKVPFTMRLETKDGKFRVTFTNIHLAWPARYSSGIAISADDFPVRRQKDLDRIRPKLLNIGEAIQAAVISKQTSTDW